jgi:uncharacterized protein (DUF2141 family)
MRSFVSRLALGLAALALSSAGGVASAQPQECHGAPSATRLYIRVEGVKSARGYVVANIYGSDKHKFLADNGWLYVWRDPAQLGDQTMCMYLPAPGSYAVVVFHDANADGDLNMGLLGPREGYGFSNNVRPIFRAPSLASSSFQAAEGDTRLHIRLRYP